MGAAVSPAVAARQTASVLGFRDLPDGGEIVYRTDEPRFVAALHEWFDAQLSDHGQDAMAGHDPGIMHHHPMDTSSAE